MVFNGPFKIRAINSLTAELSLERNIGYHQALDEKNLTNEVRPHILAGFVTASGEEIKFSYADIENKVRFFLSDAPLADREAKKGKATTASDTSVYTYVFNTENPLFANQKVRKALSIAIDRNAIAAAVSFGKAANGFIPDAFGGSADELISGGANIAVATALLSEVDFTGMSKAFTLTVADNEESRAIAALVKSAWDALGFNVTVKYEQPVTTVIGGVETTDSQLQMLVKEASYGNRQFDVIGIDWQLYSDDAFVGLSAFSTALSGCGVDFGNNNEQRTNLTGWSHADYDSYINAAYKAGGSEREDYLKKAEALLCEEAPVVPILFNESFAFVAKDLKKIEIDLFGNFIFTDAKLKNYKDYLEEN